jgi:hypothetical protein
MGCEIWFNLGECMRACDATHMQRGQVYVTMFVVAMLLL